MNARRAVPIVIWIAWIAAAAAIVAHARFTADLSAFLPSNPTPEQRLLIDQLREGPASHLILVAIDGAHGAVGDPVLASLSQRTAAALRGDARFLSVNDGETVDGASDRAFLFDHRYLLSDRVTPERFGERGLHAALDDTLDLLSSSAGLMLEPLVARDPTAELVHVAEALAAGRDLPTVDGKWVVGGPGERHALLVVETKAAGSDIDGQQRAIDALQAAFDAAKRGVGASSGAATLVLSGPPVFAVDARNTIEREARHLSIIGLVLVSLLLGFVYRSARALVLGLLPMATGATTGLAAVALGFGVVHGIALGFGVTLIGEAVDYAIYLFVQRPGAARGAGRSGFWRTIALGVGTSAIGFGALLFSGFQGLAQIGLLSIVGLVVAAAVTRWVLPAMLPAGFAVRALPRLGDVLERGAAGAARWRRPALVVAIASMIVLASHRAELWSRELGSLSPMSSATQAVDQRLRSELGAPDVRDLVVVRGPDRESVLAGSERVVATMAPLIASGALLGVEAPSRYLPSVATQKRRQDALPDDATLRRAFAAALIGTPFTKTGFDAFYADVAREKAMRPLDESDVAGTSLAPALRALLSAHRDDDGTTRWTALVAVRSAPDVDVPRARIAADLARIAHGDGVQIRIVDIKDETQNLYAGYLSEALKMAGVGALGIAALLAAALRDVRRLARVLVPLALAVVIVAAGHAIFGPMNLFHLVGLLLIVGVGSNYALFFDRRAELDRRDDDDGDDDRPVLTSLVVANLTAVIGFGVLGLSSLPVLHSIGTTVAPGALLALLLSAVFARRRAGASS